MSSSNPSTSRPSRFLEGEAVTRIPSATTDPLFGAILSEQDQHESRRSSSRSRNGSQSSTTSTSTSTSPSTVSYSPTQTSPSQYTYTSPPITHLTRTPAMRRRSKSPTSGAPVHDFGFLKTSPVERGRPRNSFEDDGEGEGRARFGHKERERVGEAIVGRFRALTAHSGSAALERKIQSGKVVPYPGT